MGRFGERLCSEMILSKVKGYKYVSFDVYDTLIVRPYVRPKDLFRHIEMEFDVPGFAEARVTAETLSRSSESGETSFHRIYDTIPDRYKHLKKTELIFETRAYCPPDIRECFEELTRTHTVILISDMYLPKGIIEGVLAVCGIRGYDRLYVSCDHNCNKGTGELFRKVLSDYDIEPNELVHFGDNYFSDFRTPAKLGIKAHHCTRPIQGYFRRNPLIWRYYKHDPCLERSLLVGLDHILSYQARGDFWYDISRRFGGPLAMDYVNFIEENRRKDDSMMFVARDGYNLKRIFDMRNPSERSEYVYAPRILNILIGSQYRRYKKYEEILVGYFYPDFEGDAHQFYVDNEADIDRKRDELFDAYASSFGEYESVSLVDVTTMKYSSQKLITDLNPDADIQGLYYFILNEEPGVPHKGYHVRDKVVKLGDNINITEFFLTSPESPVEGIGPDGKPIFKEVCDDERQRLDIYDLVTEAEVDYCFLIDEFFGDTRLHFGYVNIRDWLKVLTSPLCPNNRRHLSEMKWPVDAKHERYIGMVYHPRDTWYHLRKTVLDSMWYVSKRLKEKGNRP